MGANSAMLANARVTKTGLYPATCMVKPSFSHNSKKKQSHAHGTMACHFKNKKFFCSHTKCYEEPIGTVRMVQVFGTEANVPTTLFRITANALLGKCPTEIALQQIEAYRW